MSQTRAADGQVGSAHPDWKAEATTAARTWATVLLVGVVCGVVVVGGLSRLVMHVIAVANPVATGVVSDDGFIMGQVTLSGSAQLAGAGAQMGAVGAFVYVALRGLMIGPGWFRLLSISVGPGVVVAALLVHTNGVDFTLLQPLWLTIGSFVLLPIVYCAALHLVAERALLGGGITSTPLLALGLVLAVVAFPLTLVLAIGWWGVRALRDQVGHVTPMLSWAIRAALALAFVVAVVDLVSDARTLSGS